MFSKIKKAFACVVSCAMIFTLSACGNNAEENGDYLTGNKWETSSGMLLEFNKDGDFKWFNNKTDRDNNYYSGNYTIKIGQDAITYLEENFGFTEESQRSAMSQFSVSEECYYSVIMNNKECMQNGENTLKEENEVAYYGYYSEQSEILRLYNLDNLTHYEFTLM